MNCKKGFFRYAWLVIFALVLSSELVANNIQDFNRLVKKFVRASKRGKYQTRVRNLRKVREEIAHFLRANKVFANGYRIPRDIACILDFFVDDYQFVRAVKGSKRLGLKRIVREDIDLFKFVLKGVSEYHRPVPRPVPAPVPVPVPAQVAEQAPALAPAPMPEPVAPPEQNRSGAQLAESEQEEVKEAVAQEKVEQVLIEAHRDSSLLATLRSIFGCKR